MTRKQKKKKRVTRTSQVAFASALRDTLSKGYTLELFKKDLAAGIVVSLVALPLSMALSIAVGLPPQHGLYTAIIAGIVVALLGGSKFQVTGPTAAFVVILAPIVAEHGLRGIIWCQILAGIMLIGLGASRLGQNIKHVPHAVVTGFTTGIALVIFTLSLNDFLGLGIAHFTGSFIYKLMLISAHFININFAETITGTVTLVAILMGDKICKYIPPALTGMILGTLLGFILNSSGFTVSTIWSHFTYLSHGKTEHGLPPYPPIFHVPGVASELYKFPTWHELTTYLPSALIIAALAALESLLSATVADKIAKTKHNPNAELNGLGVGNILSGLFAGIPATGAIARTSANIHAGAVSPFAAVIHAVLILFYMLAFSFLINQIPMASLASLLIITAYKMSHIKTFRGILESGYNDEKIVLLACFLLTVFIDMVAGVCGGLGIYYLLYLKNKFAR